MTAPNLLQRGERMSEPGVAGTLIDWEPKMPCAQARMPLPRRVVLRTAKELNEELAHVPDGFAFRSEVRREYRSQFLVACDAPVQRFSEVGECGRADGGVNGCLGSLHGRLETRCSRGTGKPRVSLDPQGVAP